MSLPTIGITMGDAAGISPEILVKSLADPRIREYCEPIVLGDVRVLAAAAKAASLDLDVPRRRAALGVAARWRGVRRSSTTATSIPRP